MKTFELIRFEIKIIFYEVKKSEMNFYYRHVTRKTFEINV